MAYAGIKHMEVCHSRMRLLDCAELAADTAEHILKATKQHSANGAEAGNSNKMLVELERAAALRIRLQQLQVRLGASCCRMQPSQHTDDGVMWADDMMCVCRTLLHLRSLTTPHWQRCGTP